jgi:ABC-type multidrug transport system ATPase subunit
MTSAVLHADCVGKRFGERAVLTSASIWLHGGRLLALVGRNGAGKSTLLKICAGIMSADHGQLRYLGEWVEHPRYHRLARQGLAYLPSERNLYSSSFPLGAQFDVVARKRGSRRVAEVVEILELGDCLEQPPHTLSGGEQRRASVAVTWLLKPDCLLADEPLRGIDPKDQERIMRAYRTMASEGCAIVVTGHQAEYLLHEADEVVWVTAGTTHQLGKPAAARENWQFRREFLGIRGNVA